MISFLVDRFSECTFKPVCGLVLVIDLFTQKEAKEGKKDGDKEEDEGKGLEAIFEIETENVTCSLAFP